MSTTGNWIKNNWQIMAGVLAVGIAWGTLQVSVASNSAELFDNSEVNQQQAEILDRLEKGAQDEVDHRRICDWCVEEKIPLDKCPAKCKPERDGER